MTSAEELTAVLPFARRYARALTGSQPEGDSLVARALPHLDLEMPPRLALYAAITRLLPEGGPPAGLPPADRQLLLLTALEGLTTQEAAQVLDLPAGEAEARLAAARERLREAAAAEVLIIEDEPIIAMDLRMLAERCGHRVVGVAASEAEAEAMAAAHPPGLILADVNLGRGGNGIEAVRRILGRASAPVIFVTAYPELLLTASGLEPAFVIRKPFDPVSLAISTYQAITAGRVPLA